MTFAGLWRRVIPIGMLLIASAEARAQEPISPWEAKHLNLDGTETCGITGVDNDGMFGIELSAADPASLKVDVVDHLLDDSRLSADLAVSITFDNSDSIALVGRHSTISVDMTLAGADVRRFIHDFTAAHAMVIKVGSAFSYTGTWPLGGTTPAVMSMGECAKTYIPSPPAPFVGNDVKPAEAAPKPLLTGSQGLPTEVGTCTFTQVKNVENRLFDGATGRPSPGSGSAINFMNGGYQVSYDQIAEVDAAQSGDRVMMCLAYKPANCPKGDDRGKVYTTTDYRTGKSWSLPDSEHQCGGA